jgi:hypothetical protein
MPFVVDMQSQFLSLVGIWPKPLLPDRKKGEKRRKEMCVEIFVVVVQ